MELLPPPPSVAPPSVGPPSPTVNQNSNLSVGQPIKLMLKRRASQMKATTEEIRDLEKAAAESLVKAHYLCCPGQNCKYQITRSEKKKKHRCPSCRTVFCEVCGEEEVYSTKIIHGGLSCLAYQALKLRKGSNINDFFHCDNCYSFSENSICATCGVSLSQTKITGSSAEIEIKDLISLPAKVFTIEVCEDDYPEMEFVSVAVENGCYILDLSRYTFKIHGRLSGLQLAVLPYTGTLFAIPSHIKTHSYSEDLVSSHYVESTVNLGPKPGKRTCLYLYFALYSKNELKAVSDVFPVFINRTWQEGTKNKQKRFALPLQMEIIPAPRSEPAKFFLDDFVSIRDYTLIVDPNKKKSWQPLIRKCFDPEFQGMVVEFLLLTSRSFVDYFFSHFDKETIDETSKEENSKIFLKLLDEWKAALEKYPQAEEMTQLHDMWAKMLYDIDKVKALRQHLNLSEPAIQYHMAGLSKKARREAE